MQTPKPIPFRPTPSTLERRIREIAKDDDAITWGDHAFDRSDERDISIRDAQSVLRTGFVKGEVRPGKKTGEWKCKMVKQMKGRREIGVVAVIIRDREIFVPTVEWEDLR